MRAGVNREILTLQIARSRGLDGPLLKCAGRRGSHRVAHPKLAGRLKAGINSVVVDINCPPAANERTPGKAGASPNRRIKAHVPSLCRSLTARQRAATQASSFPDGTRSPLEY